MPNSRSSPFGAIRITASPLAQRLPPPRTGAFSCPQIARHFQEIGMAKRSSRSTNTARQNDAKVTNLFDSGWTPLGHAPGAGSAAGAGGRDQRYRRTVRPQSVNQRALIEAMAAHHLTLALGPAGTGKTYLAVTAAVEAIEAGKVGRIVLTRP